MLKGPAIGMVLLILTGRGVRRLRLVFPLAIGCYGRARASRSWHLLSLLKLIEVAVGLVVVFMGKGILADSRRRRVRIGVALRKARCQHCKIGCYSQSSEGDVKTVMLVRFAKCSESLRMEPIARSGSGCPIVLEPSEYTVLRVKAYRCTSRKSSLVSDSFSARSDGVSTAEGE